MVDVLTVIFPVLIRRLARCTHFGCWSETQQRLARWESASWSIYCHKQLPTQSIKKKSPEKVNPVYNSPLGAGGKTSCSIYGRLPCSNSAAHPMQTLRLLVGDATTVSGIGKCQLDDLLPQTVTNAIHQKEITGKSELAL